jgi:Phospholipase_D-nuclease N-terminal
MGRKEKSWSDLTHRQRQAAVAGAVIEAIVTAAALRDLASRQPDEVRGPKLFWRLSFVVQPIGPVAYFLAGRRATD